VTYNSHILASATAGQKYNFMGLTSETVQLSFIQMVYFITIKKYYSSNIAIVDVLLNFHRSKSTQPAAADVTCTHPTAAIQRYKLSGIAADMPRLLSGYSTAHV